MAYGDGSYPTELANKVGHVRLIQDPMIRRIVEAFQDTRESPVGAAPPPSGRLELLATTPLRQVVTIDGGHQAIPNIARPERQIGFVQVAVQLVSMDTIEHLRQHPMADPRDVQRDLNRLTHHIFAAVPVCGLHLEGMTLQRSLREAIHRFLEHYDLYQALSYLVYRDWEAVAQETAAMDCLACATRFALPRRAIHFRCPHCVHEHHLSDYLGLTDSDAEDRSTLETVSSLRSVLEVLAMFSIIVRFRDQEAILSRTLFLLDGPLLLRAQLSRLVEPIRSFLAFLRDRRTAACIVGVEKSGELRAFADAYSSHLTHIGDYFIPDTRFLVEEVNGHAFDGSTYRNRVNYGAKVLVRLGPNHVIVANVPTGEYRHVPSTDHLMGFSESMRLLAQLVSYRYTNALIPIVLANTSASIANQPSGSILGQFVDSLLHNDG